MPVSRVWGDRRHSTNWENGQALSRTALGAIWLLRLYSSSIVFGVMKGGEGREVAALSSESDLYPNFVL